MESYLARVTIKKMSDKRYFKAEMRVAAIDSVKDAGSSVPFWDLTADD
jgi:hypothetical protein